MIGFFVMETNMGVHKDYRPLHEAMNAYRAAMRDGHYMAVPFLKLKYEDTCKEFKEDPEKYLEHAIAIERAMRKGY